MNQVSGFQIEDDVNLIISFARFVHQRFIWFLLGGYVIAGLWPAWGLWIRHLTLGQIEAFQEQTLVSLPMLMLAFLLFNAGMGVELAGLRELPQNLKILVVGVAANLLVPLGFIFLVSRVMGFWHNLDETQNILVGLALIASMPIAGSSTAWTQNANGNMTISLGLVLATTFLSPLTTPLILHAVGAITTGDYSEDLHELATHGTGMFLAICVIIPSGAGILLRVFLSRNRMVATKPYLKLMNAIVLLLLIYSNASVALPKAISHPDMDFLSVMLFIAISLCSLAFFFGWMLAMILQIDSGQRTALMFGLGMNNNGTGLVLAAMALADHPQVMLPIIMYNLIQHLVAGSVNQFLFTERVGKAEPAGSGGRVRP